MALSGLRSGEAPHAPGEAIFGVALERCETGIVILDAQARIVFWNRWMAGASGVPAAAALGRTLAEIFPQARLTRIGQAIGESDHFLIDGHAPVIEAAGRGGLDTI